VIAVHDRAQQVGVLHDEALDARNMLVLKRHLPTRDRAVIADVDRTALSLRKSADELGHELGLVVARELSGER
jgi:hypothetical protein